MRIRFKKVFFLSLFLAFVFFILFTSTAKAATYTVTKTADTNDGTCNSDCSFREAIAAANANSGLDEIDFNIPESDPGYIQPSGSTQGYFYMPTTIGVALSITDNAGVFINGYSQPGASRNTAAFGEPINAVLKIQFYYAVNDYFYFNGNNTHMAGLDFRNLRSTSGVLTINSSNNWIEGNYFGSNITGTATSNSGSFQIASGGASNTFGTNGDGNDDVGERNLFMGQVGSSPFITGYVWADGSSPPGNNNIIAGNYFGTDRTGRVCTTATIYGMAVQIDSSGNRVGTNYDGVSDSEEANIIGCTNNTYRAFLRLLGGNNNLIQGNYIGISPYGDSLGSLFGTGRGAVGMAWDANATGNIIKGNTISNGDYGILASLGTGNTFSQNKIYGNSLLDIRIGASSTQLANDSGDTDTGINDLMNYPIIDSVNYLGGDKFDIHGSLDGKSSEAPYTIEICKSSEESWGYGGCLESLATFSLPSPGNWEVNVSVPDYSEFNQISFTSLATNTNGSTSEFGNNFKWYVITAPASQSSYVFSAAPATVITSTNDTTSLVSSKAFNYDAYLSVSDTPKTSIFNIPGTSYWQVGPKKEIWWKANFNDAKILPSEVNKPFTLVLKYNEGDLGPNLPEKNIKVAYSNDGGKSWKILQNYLLDTKNNTVAFVTKHGGLYMFVSGYSKNTSVSGVSTATNTSQPKTIAIPKVQNISSSQVVSEKKKHCIWFFCW